jgi:hypothetical protein
LDLLKGASRIQSSPGYTTKLFEAKIEEERDERGLVAVSMTRLAQWEPTTRAPNNSVKVSVDVREGLDNS